MTKRSRRSANEGGWHQGAVFYQIYPRSFADSNNDGIGDLRGITQKLDYIAGLGVEGVWISPFFKSPQKDYGYDVSDYRDIDPLFGTPEDFDELLEEAHKRGLKIIIDLVLSHTSDQHPWFTEKPDYYVWADGAPPEGKGRRSPNNWVSIFGGSAWEWHEGRGQYYLHNFLKSQPDLNFHNPEVQKEALDIARFWLERGVDGFRLDVINFLFHDPQLRDNPPRDKTIGAATQFEGDDPYSHQQHIYDKSRPEALEFLEKFRALMDEYPGTMTLGEIGDDHPYQRAAEYTAPGRLDTCYNPQMMAGKTKELTASLIREPIEAFLTARKKLKNCHPEQSEAQSRDLPPDEEISPLPTVGRDDKDLQCWPSWAFSNHDVVRAASRWLPPSRRSRAEASAEADEGGSNGFSHNPKLSKMLIALLGCLYGTVFLYQGEELGLPEAKLEYEQLQDPWGKHLWPEWQGRDGCRTPMPWDNARPANNWLPIPDSHIPLNVKAQNADPNSTLNFTRNFLKWRAAQPALIRGDIAFHDTNNEKKLSFTRQSEAQTIECFFNLETWDYEILSS